MKEHVTVIPQDSTIIVDGIPLSPTFTATKEIHAIQWHSGGGHVEYTDGRMNTQLTGASDYARLVEPYVRLWEAEKARQDEIVNRPPTLEEAREARLAFLLSTTRNKILAGFQHVINGQTYHFSYDEESQSNFAKANSAALFAVITGDAGFRQTWRGWQEDTPFVFNLTAEEYMGLSRAGGEHQLWYQKHCWEKEAAIKAASSIEGLNAIIIA